MKSMCQESRRNSPSVADLEPGVALERDRVRGSRRPRPLEGPRRRARPAAWRARAARSSCGRNRLPTWSARYGGVRSAEPLRVAGYLTERVRSRRGAAESNLDAIVAIDVHTHAEVSRTGLDPLLAGPARGRGAGTSAASALPTAEDVAAYYRERQHGRRRLRRRQRVGHRRTRRSRTRRSPRSRPRTPTC